VFRKVAASGHTGFDLVARTAVDNRFGFAWDCSRDVVVALRNVWQSAALHRLTHTDGLIASPYGTLQGKFEKIALVGDFVATIGGGHGDRRKVQLWTARSLTCLMSIDLGAQSFVYGLLPWPSEMRLRAEVALERDLALMGMNGQ